MNFLTIISALYFFLPAGIANMAPVLCSKYKFLNYPVDFGRSLNRVRIFGDHKTWRGIFFGLLFAVLTVFIQRTLFMDYPIFGRISIIDYANINFILFGILLGIGALFGDLVKSFFKRRSHITPGKSWIPFDQIDYVIGGLLFSFIVFIPPITHMIIIIIAYPLFHIITNHIGFMLHLSKSKW
jgi:CDP-2,3-bis-(O-geranylgeranyl)-sn-glycerol synthase